MKKLILLALTVVLNPVFAATGDTTDDRSALVEGCKALKSAVKRENCLESLARLPAKQEEPVIPVVETKPAVPEKSAAEIESDRIDVLKKKFEGVNRAATAIQSATSVGLSYNQYGAYIQQLATEVAMFKQNANSESEKAAILLLERAIEAYQDAGTFWAKDIEFYSYRDNSLAYMGGLPLGMTGMEWIASKYDIPTQKSDIWGFNRGIPRALGLSTIWRKAQEWIEQANSALLSKPNDQPA